MFVLTITGSGVWISGMRRLSVGVPSPGPDYKLQLWFALLRFHIKDASPALHTRCV